MPRYDTRANPPEETHRFDRGREWWNPLHSWKEEECHASHAVVGLSTFRKHLDPTNRQLKFLESRIPFYQAQIERLKIRTAWDWVCRPPI